MQAGAQAWQVFDMANEGLPSNTVLDIAVQPDGVVWAASDWGLWRWENGEHEVFQTSNSDLPDNSLRALLHDSQGRLWIGTSISGAVLFDGQDWQIFSTLNSEIPDDQVNTIHEDGNGWIWFGTVSGLACYTGSEWRVYDSTPSSYNGRVLNGDHILSIDSRDDGLMVLGTLNSGFHFLTDTSVHFFTTFNSGFWDNTQRGVLLDLDADERWVATPAAGLLRQFGDWYGGTWFQYNSFNSDLPTNALVGIDQDATGNLWLASQVAGLIRRDASGSYSSYTSANSALPVNTLNDVTVAPDGGIWVALYDGGAARFDPTLGTEQMNQEDPGFRILPTLNDGTFTVHVENAFEPIEWSISDASGRLHASGRAQPGKSLRFEGLRLSPGGYIMSIFTGGKPMASRFLVH